MVRSLCTAIVLLCVALASADSTSAQKPQPAEARDDKGAIAVLRRDGVIFPFASFDRDFWEVTWPLALRDIKLPATPKDVPQKWWGKGGLDGWRAHLVTGETIDVDVRAIGGFRPFCVDRLGLATTYKSKQPLPARQERPYPKDGIAVRANTPIEPIEAVDPASAEAAELMKMLVREFDKVEDRTAGQVRVATGWTHPLEGEVRRKFPVRLESWYRSPSGEPGWTVSYIEASRAYPPAAEDKGCGLETYVSGWIHQFRGAIEKADDLRGKLTYCDRVGVVYMLPFGRIRPRTKDYWVFQLSGWTDEWYGVAEVGRERVRQVIEVNAGGCRP